MTVRKAYHLKLDRRPDADKVRAALLKRLANACSKMPLAQIHIFVSTAEMATEDEEEN